MEQLTTASIATAVCVAVLSPAVVQGQGTTGGVEGRVIDDIGRPLVAGLPAALGGKQVELTDPDGKKHKLDVSTEGGRALAHYDATRQPGLKPGELAVRAVAQQHAVGGRAAIVDDHVALHDQVVREHDRAAGDVPEEPVPGDVVLLAVGQYTVLDAGAIGEAVGYLVGEQRGF